MVAINFEQDPTLAAMKLAVEGVASQEPPRNYLGASAIGDECARKLWLTINPEWIHERYSVTYKPMPYNNVAAIEDGHRTEDLIVERMRLVDGLQLWTKDDNGEQYGFDWGFLSGHYDGVILGLFQAPKTPHIFEVKCCKDKKYAALQKCIRDYGEKNALKHWDEVYYAQAVIYMEAEELTRHYLVCSLPGGRDQISVRTEANPKFAKALIEKAKRIHGAKEPPERIAGKDYFKCKWCKFYEVCHGA